MKMTGILFLLFAIAVPTWAQVEPVDELDKAAEEKPVKSSKVKAKVLDFEAELIEGERKSPNLFLQMELETPNLDAVMYKRRHFNDFHQVELDRKPAYKGN